MIITVAFILLVQKFQFASSNYLEDNFEKIKGEKNSKLNKGLWFKNFKDNQREPVTGFLFRPSSLDVDNFYQNNFDSFGENDMQGAPVVSSYVERTRRAANLGRQQRHRKSLTGCNGNLNCNTEKGTNDDTSLVKISKLKPSSVFNDYPYEVAVLLSNKNTPNPKNIKTNNTNNTNNTKELKPQDAPSQLNMDSIVKSEVENLKSLLKNTTTSPKRSMNDEYESQIIKKIELNEELNNTNNFNTNNIERNIFDKETKVWHQNPPLTELNMYSVVPKEEHRINKPISERGLVKVLSMLTRTFKKIVRQHEDIKKIQNKVENIHEEFNKNVAAMKKKFEDFDSKHSLSMKFLEKLKQLEVKMNTREFNNKKKEKELSKNLLEFQDQQRKFLSQQRQFYNIQKLMLSQNEKINIKQNLIAKTQSEISYRQNNFSRVLKKAKQLLREKKPNTTELSKTLFKVKDPTTTTPIPSTIKPNIPTTESIKINLLSMPSVDRPNNQDNLILKEKDEQPIDDLVYKYYFNNTFIDNLMKNKILSGFATVQENTETGNIKIKRDDQPTKTSTKKIDDFRKIEFSSNVREKRWISHSRRKPWKKNRGKDQTPILNIDDEKIINMKRKNFFKNIGEGVTTKQKRDNVIKPNNPFLTMATAFCNEIGQNSNEQALKWCVEKALRRLHYMDIKMTGIPTTNPPEVGKQQNLNDIGPFYTPVPLNVYKLLQSVADTTGTVTSVTPSSPTTKIDSTAAVDSESSPASTLMTESTQAFMFFPDNDELESNLKQYDLKPDTEGNFYFDGSLHISDIALGRDSEEFSDVMPGLESNSHVEVDPIALDLQAKRRAYVRRINSSMKRKILENLKIRQ